MKRYVKTYLKSMRTHGFKWDTDPLELFEKCTKYEDSKEPITITKGDLKRIFRFAMLDNANNVSIIKNINTL
jgi:hypothetical protein